MLLDRKLEIYGTYDSGSQISLINAKLVKTINQNEDKNKLLIKTVNGVKKTDGLITIKIKIFDFEEEVDIFIVDREDFEDFLIGLDMIKKFKLTQDGKLRISQEKIDKTNESNKIKIDTEEEKKRNIEQCSVNFNEHVEEDEFQIKLEHLDKMKKKEIEKLINTHKSVFAKDKYDVGTVKDYEARIDLLVDKYSSRRPYKCNIDDKKEIEKQIARLLEKKLIEESYSPFAAPVTLAYKRDEGKKSRLCIDFRDLNKNIIPQAQPFPMR